MQRFGATRSASRRDHLLQTPDTFVRTPLPGLACGAAIVHASPQMGAAFAMMTVEFEPNGTLTQGSTQRLVYVLEGSLEVRELGVRRPRLLEAGGFAYLAATTAHTLLASSKTRALLIDKPYVPLDAAEASLREPLPASLFGHEEELDTVALNGDRDIQVRALLPASPGYDFAVNTMTYSPGASLGQVEIHTMEHGLMMLHGGGIYRLGDPVAAGDCVWMAPFCPQWFGALGRSPSKYLLYKDWNRNVLA